MTPTEKAAPIPAEVPALAEHFATLQYGSHEPNTRGWQERRDWFARAIMQDRADREARPSLPDSREERDSPANLAKRVLAMREHLRHERADGVDFGTLTVVARTLTAIASADRARARQGGNNG